MGDEFIKKAKKYLRVGGIIAGIFSILISLFLYYLFKISFICMDAKLCN